MVPKSAKKRKRAPNWSGSAKQYAKKMQIALKALKGVKLHQKVQKSAKRRQEAQESAEWCQVAPTSVKKLQRAPNPLKRNVQELQLADDKCLFPKPDWTSVFCEGKSRTFLQA